MIDNNTKDFLGTLAGWALDADLGRSLQGAGSDIREAKRLIEYLSAENERLREALAKISLRKWNSMTQGCNAAREANDIARAALGETK